VIASCRCIANGHGASTTPDDERRCHLVRSLSPVLPHQWGRMTRYRYAMFTLNHERPCLPDEAFLCGVCTSYAAWRRLINPGSRPILKRMPRGKSTRLLVESEMTKRWIFGVLLVCLGNPAVADKMCIRDRSASHAAEGAAVFSGRCADRARGVSQTCRVTPATSVILGAGFSPLFSNY